MNAQYSFEVPEMTKILFVCGQLGISGEEVIQKLSDRSKELLLGIVTESPAGNLKVTLSDTLRMGIAASLYQDDI